MNKDSYTSRLLSLYKSYCNNTLTTEDVIAEMTTAKVEIDRSIVKQEQTDNLDYYYNELEYLLFTVMRYE